ncbi:MAG TPA: diaminopimelate epimerase [Acidimicrobiales bacterium]|nr:diaminopimelate epimerase [Acidimicrobiales bacterium]
MRLTKHHGFGNDFLVLLDGDASHPLAGDVARALCDRRTGVGADGLIRATRLDPAADDTAGGAVAAMELRNADGSPAETSGNGIRCLAQALILAGWADGPTIPIRTDAGRRIVTLHDRSDALTYTLSVEMGVAHIAGEAPEWTGGPIRRSLRVDVGNPHLVLDVGGRDDEIDLVELGDSVNAKVPGGANVHLLSGETNDRVAIRTYERGVGPTLACGSGACAAAVAGRAWGIVGDKVAVDQAGGTAHVTMGGDGDVVLRGLATWVATVELPEGWPWR